jgi:hypothetical protein
MNRRGESTLGLILDETVSFDESVSFDETVFFDVFLALVVIDVDASIF